MSKKTVAVIVLPGKVAAMNVDGGENGKAVFAKPPAPGANSKDVRTLAGQINRAGKGLCEGPVLVGATTDPPPFPCRRSLFWMWSRGSLWA